MYDELILMAPAPDRIPEGSNGTECLAAFRKKLEEGIEEAKVLRAYIFVGPPLHHAMLTGGLLLAGARLGPQSFVQPRPRRGGQAG